jgi:hypothetical protein
MNCTSRRKVVGCHSEASFGNSSGGCGHTGVEGQSAHETLRNLSLMCAVLLSDSVWGKCWIVFESYCF